MTKKATRPTGFKQWREAMGFTLDQAAEALGISKSQAQNFDAGVDRTRGRTSVPSEPMRILMRLIASKKRVEPWPE